VRRTQNFYSSRLVLFGHQDADDRNSHTGNLLTTNPCRSHLRMYRAPSGDPCAPLQERLMFLVPFVPDPFKLWSHKR